MRQVFVAWPASSLHSIITPCLISTLTPSLALLFLDKNPLKLTHANISYRDTVYQSKSAAQAGCFINNLFSICSNDATFLFHLLSQCDALAAPGNLGTQPQSPEYIATLAKQRRRTALGTHSFRACYAAGKCC